MTPHIQVELSLEQARAVSQALDLYTRMGLGQMREIADLVRSGAIPFSDRRQTDDQPAAMDALDDLAAAMSRELGFAPNASYGIGNEHVPLAARRAYELQKVLDKALAEHRNPSPSFRGVDYDGLLVRYTHDPAPQARVVGIADQGEPLSMDNQLSSAAKHSQAIDDALGLESVTIKLPAKALRGLEREAVQQGLLLNAMLRNILQAYGMQSADRSGAHTVMMEVIAERAKQDSKWGGPIHDDQHGLEYFCGSINTRTAEMARGFESANQARARLIEIAALAVAAVESLDRKEAGRGFIAQLRDASEQAPLGGNGQRSNPAVNISIIQDEWDLPPSQS